LQVGGGDKKETPRPTLGQQLTDLKTARDAGAITDAEYEMQKAKLLHGK
jgi:Short C-terminal domain